MNIKIPPLKTVVDSISFAKAINPKKAPLTVERLKNFPGCEHYNDEQVAHIIQTIDLLTTILVETISRKGKTHPNQAEVAQIETFQNQFLSINSKAA